LRSLWPDVACRAAGDPARTGGWWARPAGNATGPASCPGRWVCCGGQWAMGDRPCRLGPAGCRRRYSAHTPSAASVPLPRATSPGMIQRLARWAAAGVADCVGGPVTAGADTAGAVTVGPVAGGGTGAGVVVGDAGARTTRVAETPRLPPQRPVMV
jgi:hypothetical protein